MADRRDEILESMRSRILRGLQSGTLEAGDRLPSARALERELEVDHRMVLDVYRELAAEGLIETRPRGGVYVAARHSAGGIPPLPEAWFAEVLAEGVAREIPVPELIEWLRRCTETLRLRAVVVTTTTDQAAGLCRELRDDFGLEAEAVPVTALMAQPPVVPLRRADLIVTTAAHAVTVRKLGDEAKKPVIVIDVRPDIIGGEWRLLLQRPVYAVVASAEFAKILRRFVGDTPGAENLRTLIVGEDDLAAIPADASTYVTQQARTLLGDFPVPGRVVPAARTIGQPSAREIMRFIVRANREALTRAAR